MAIATFFAGDPPESSDAIDSLLLFDFGMLAICWRLFSSASVTEAHKFVGPPNAIQLAADAMPHVVNAIVHLAAAKVYYDTGGKKKAKKQTHKVKCSWYLEIHGKFKERKLF